MRSKSSTKRLMAGGALALAISLAAAGCGEQSMSVREVKEKYALMLRDGAAAGMMVISVGEVDPETLDLIDVRLEDGTRILHAERGELIVDADEQSVALRLTDVVATNTEGGELRTFPGMTAGPFPLPYKVTSAAE